MPSPDTAAETTAATHYDGAGKAIHWAVVALVAGQFVTALLLPHIKLDTPLDTTINLHFNLGLAILVTMAARLVHRFRHPVRVAPRSAPGWERTLASATHRIFYLVLLVGPFLGWAAASAHGIPVRLLGMATLPALAPREAEWGFAAGDIHGYTMWTLLGLVGVHAAAALYHHFVRRDDVLQRMLFPRASTGRDTRRM